MQAADYIELTILSSDVTAGHVMNAVSIIFAYVLAAHFVGARMARFQMLAASALYLGFLAFPLLSVATGLARAGALAAEFHRAFPELAPLYVGSGAYLGALRIGLLLILVLGCLLSLAYMIQVRRR